ncbi:SdpI family protein [Gorillibacterium timonense]|uniref:SdpI family protein n=1 Tax=Gorillibacterium timonense TaxID=1689269 RepID=UPI00071D064E|nr:SdpI family protein [Gorillibacterium timonense]
MNKFVWKWQDTVIVLLGLGAFIFALVNYNRLPDQLPIHFSTGGVDRYGDKLSSLGLLVCLGLFLPLAMGVARHIDPKRSNYAKFENAFAMLRLVIAVLLDLVLVATVLYGLGYSINMTNAVLAGVGVLLIIMGNYIPQIKDNYFIGIRTPWTLNSPEVWRKTHRLGGRLWVLAGILVAIGTFLPSRWSTAIILLSMIPLVVIPTFYSWSISRKQE